MRTVIGQHGMDLVGNGFDQPAQEIPSDTPAHALVQLGEGELARAVKFAKIPSLIIKTMSHFGFLRFVFCL